MASQSENPVSVELGELLDLLNALEAQDSRPSENFATLERLLAAGKNVPVESSSDDHDAVDHYAEARYFEDHQSAVEAVVDRDSADAEEPKSREELIAQRPDWRDEEKPEAEIDENRLAVHIIQGLRKSIKDRTS